MIHVDLNLKKGAAELQALTRHYAGLQFNRLMLHEWLDQEPGYEYVFVSVSGSALDLERHGFLNVGEVAKIPKCGVRYYRDHDGNRVHLHRLSRSLRVECWVPLEVIAVALAPAIWSPIPRKTSI